MSALHLLTFYCIRHFLGLLDEVLDADFILLLRHWNLGSG